MDDEDWRISNRIWIHYTAVAEHCLKLLADPPPDKEWRCIGFDENHNLTFEIIGKQK